MYRFLLYTISFFASLPYLQAAPVAQQDWDQLIWPGGGQTPCQNFQFMSMGALEVYNHNKFPIYLYWYYAGKCFSCSKTPHSSLISPRAVQ